MYTVLLPPGFNPIAVNKYIKYQNSNNNNSFKHGKYIIQEIYLELNHLILGFPVQPAFHIL
jgi:hypothetical protein